MNQHVIEMVNTMMTEQFELAPESLIGSANLRTDLKLDSLDFVDMLVFLESKVGNPITDIDFMSIQTLNDVYGLVSSILPAEQTAQI